MVPGMTYPIDRATAVRVIASSLCFDQDPPPVRSLDKAKIAAGAILDAMVQAGMIDVASQGGTSNGGRPSGTAAVVDPDQDALPLP
jgi:hypothetical protein